jgi:hypothetical protein
VNPPAALCRRLVLHMLRECAALLVLGAVRGEAEFGVGQKTPHTQSGDLITTVR